MSVSRRKFLELGSLFVAATAVPLQAAVPAARTTRLDKEEFAFPAKQQSEVVSLNYMTKDTFASHVNSTFLVSNNAGIQARLTLISVQDTSSAATGRPTKSIRKTSSFALRFKSRSGKTLPQGTYLFDHISLGRFALFVVPAGGSQPYYTAIFNKV